MLHRIGDDVDAALEELRSLAAGVYPSLLPAGGLHDALRTAALQSPLPVTVAVDGADRYSDDDRDGRVLLLRRGDAERRASTRRDASGVAISLSRNGDLRFEVRDDGHGFAPDAVAPGDGLHQHARPHGRGRRRARDPLGARIRHDGDRHDPGARSLAAVRAVRPPQPAQHRGPSSCLRTRVAAPDASMAGLMAGLSSTEISTTKTSG